MPNLWIALHLLLLGSADERKDPPQPAAIHQTMVVTATGLREEIADSVSMVTSIGREQLRRSPALTLDDRLRRVPGFSLFRRSSSLTAHPTTQGVSLRGIGPSGTSRSLVLFDGVPLNDPFGGWVYWNRIPIAALQSVEVARGAGSQLYGSSSLGGTLQLLPLRPRSETTFLSGQTGDPAAYDFEMLHADRRGDWSYLASGRLFDTEGFFIVDEELRGEVDRRARSEFQSFYGRVDYKDFHVSANVFHEGRGNGTELQRNSSRIAFFESGFQRPGWSWNFHVQSGRFDNAFSRILSDRSQEFLTAQQRFDSYGIGSSFVGRLGQRLTFGGDWRQTGWDGNRQNLAGIFAQALAPIAPRLDLLAGIRFDVWENREVQGEINPRLGLSFRPSHRLTLRTSAYRGFRAPTLNELFRPFRVGNVITEANDQLDSETLWGVEAGVDYHPSGNLLVRLNSFFNALQGPVGNVTQSVTPDLIRRQRQNLGRVNIQGGEAEIHWRQGNWHLHAAYLYSVSQVRESRRRLPQQPLHQGTIGLSWDGFVGVDAEARFLSSQFDDDLNRFALGGYALYDFSIRKRIGVWEAFAAVENLFDREYPVGQTPIERLGTPRLVHAGLRWTLER